MTNAVVLSLIKVLAKWLVGSAFFKDAVNAVKEFNETKLQGAQKKSGVMAQLEAEGWRVTGKTMNTAIELAVNYVDRLA